MQYRKAIITANESLAGLNYTVRGEYGDLVAAFVHENEAKMFAESSSQDTGNSDSEDDWNLGVRQCSSDPEECETCQ